VAERWKRRAKGDDTNAEGVRIDAPYAPRIRRMWRRFPCPSDQRASGASWAHPVASGVQSRPKTNLVHFVARRKAVTATICLICFNKHCSCSLSLLFWTLENWNNVITANRVTIYCMVVMLLASRKPRRRTSKVWQSRPRRRLGERDWETGCPPPQATRGLGSVVSSVNEVRGGDPVKNEVGPFCGR